MMDTDKLKGNVDKSTAVLQHILTAEPVTLGNGEAPALLSDAKVTVAKGYNLNPERPELGHDALEISMRTEAARSSEAAEAIGRMMLETLDKIPTVRKHAILKPEKEYLAQVQGNTRALLTEAKNAGIEGCNVDLASAKIYDPSFSMNQIGDYAVDLIEGPAETTLRVQVATNPKKPGEALAKANEIEANLKARLPAMKAAAIKRAKDKSYIPNMTDEVQKQLEGHTFETSVQQQQNEWTSVFIHVRSPDQQKHKEHPEEKVDLDTLGKTNLFSMIPEQKNRFKLASRIVLFEGEKLKEPADFFLDIAGTQDMKTALGKVMARLKEKKPDLAEKIDTLLAEDVFHKRRQWNLPPGEREDWKSHGSAYVSTRDPDMVKVYINLPKGVGEQVLEQIAAMEVPAPAQASAAPAADAAALAASGAMATAPDGTQLAVACGAAAAQTAEQPLAEGVLAKIGPNAIGQNTNIADLLKQGPGAIDPNKLTEAAMSTTSGRQVG